MVHRVKAINTDSKHSRETSFYRKTDFTEFKYYTCKLEADRKKTYAGLGTEDVSLRMCLTMLPKSPAHHLLGKADFLRNQLDFNVLMSKPKPI